jgi:hypothetical protein
MLHHSVPFPVTKLRYSFARSFMKTSTDEPAKDEDDREDLFETAVLGPARRAVLSSLRSAVTLTVERAMSKQRSMRRERTCHRASEVTRPITK